MKATRKAKEKGIALATDKESASFVGPASHKTKSGPESVNAMRFFGRRDPCTQSGTIAT